MFKRRKTDEPPILAAPRAAPLLDALPPAKDTTDHDAQSPLIEQLPSEPPPAEAAASNAPPEPAQADTELGVPPYRAPSYRPDVPKEPTPMARPPFPNSPSPSPSSQPMGQPMGQPLGMMSNTRPTSLTVAAPPTPAPAPEAAARRTLVVGRGISLQGTVTDAERLVVDGTVEASMIRATELSVSQGGIFKGEIEVEDAEVARHHRRHGDGAWQPDRAGPPARCSASPIAAACRSRMAGRSPGGSK